jgi:uncharacterized protein (TIGR03000 family)
MRNHRVWAAALLGLAAVLLTPAAGKAQVSIRVGTPYYGYAYGYAPAYYSYGYFPYSWGYASPYVGGYVYSPSYLSGYYGTYIPPTYSPSPGYYSSPPTTYSYSASPDTSPYYSYGAMPSAGTRDTALLNVRLPAPNAEIWVQGQPTQQRGTWREYISPRLNPDQNYVYDVRARWTENGREVERTRSVPVQANGIATVDFTAAENR